MAIFSGIFFIIFITTSVIMYAVLNAKLGPDSKEVIAWKANFAAGGCGQMDMTNALHN